jgi:hypothetical protein
VKRTTTRVCPDSSHKLANPQDRDNPEFANPEATGWYWLIAVGGSAKPVFESEGKGKLQRATRLQEWRCASPPVHDRTIGACPADHGSCLCDLTHTRRKIQGYCQISTGTLDTLLVHLREKSSARR